MGEGIISYRFILPQEFSVEKQIYAEMVRKPLALCKRFMTARPMPFSAVPSASQLGVLQEYAQQRLEASRELSEGLRTRDPRKIKQAIEQAKKAGARAKGVPEALSK